MRPFPSASGGGGRAEEVLVSAVDGAEFAYLGTEGWLPEWPESTNLPSAVRLDITVNAAGGRVTLSETAVLPLGEVLDDD